jgi:hypothetical protein
LSFAGIAAQVAAVEEPSEEYSLWVKLANDPSQPEQLRQHYRTLMEEHLHQQLREAFRLASQKVAPRS